MVLSTSGKLYTVDTSTGFCSCPSARYRPGPCKHLLAALRFDQEQRAVPAATVG